MLLKRTYSLNNIIHVLKGFVRLVFPPPDERRRPREKGYVYFQELLPGVDHDIRIIVIGNRAFGIKRYIRKGDFRASGSGIICYDHKEIPEECIKTAFKINTKIQAQCIAYDFMISNSTIHLLEISYSFTSESYLKCPGYWDDKLCWHEGKFTPEYFMIKDFLKLIENKNAKT
jgi:hypothetical protein